MVLLNLVQWDMNPVRELDPLDKSLLEEIAVLGERGAKSDAEKLQLDRLAQEGYLTAIRHDAPGRGHPPAWSYRLR
jgi:hypothetical protein